jgi:outer membrane protein assembly factor BamB
LDIAGISMKLSAPLMCIVFLLALCALSVQPAASVDAGGDLGMAGSAAAIQYTSVFNASASREVWNFGAGRDVLCAAISGDGQYIVAGTDRGGAVYLMDQKGRPLWSRPEVVPVYGVAISPDGSFMASASDRLYLLYPHGGEKWNRNTGYFFYGVALSAYGELIAAGSDDDRVYLLDRDGTVLWEYLTGGSVFAVSMSEDASLIAAGSDDGRVYLFNENGDLQWSYMAGREVRSIAASMDGGYVVAGSYDRIVYFFDNTGRLLWKYAMNDPVTGVTISSDGSYCAACAGPKVVLFDRQGAIVWEYDSGASGNYVGETSSGIPIGPEISAVALSPSALSLVFGTGAGDQSVHLYSFEEKIAVTPSPTPSPAPSPTISGIPWTAPPGYEGNLDLAPSVTIISMIRENHGDRSDITVRLAVPAAWANATGNMSIRVLAWGDQPEPDLLETRLVGSDMQGNLVFEATAPGDNVTFGVARVPAASVDQGASFFGVDVVILVFVLAACIIGIGSFVVWRKQQKEKMEEELFSEEQMRSLQESLKTLQRK